MSVDGGRVIAMPDGRSWRVVRRHEMARILTRRDSGERRVFLFFFADDGGCRRAEIGSGFPDVAAADADTLAATWRSAEVLR
jgi:hypothetical protein